jgi:hypothetical protein
MLRKCSKVGAPPKVRGASPQRILRIRSTPTFPGLLRMSLALLFNFWREILPGVLEAPVFLAGLCDVTPGAPHPYCSSLTFDQRANWHSDRAYVLSDRVSLLLFVTGAPHLHLIWCGLHGVGRQSSAPLSPHLPSVCRSFSAPGCIFSRRWFTSVWPWLSDADVSAVPPLDALHG